MNRMTCIGAFSALLAWSAAVTAVGQGIENTPDTVVFSVEGGVQYEDNRDATERGHESMTTLRFTPGVRLNVDDEITRAFLSYRPSGLWRDNPRDDQNESEIYQNIEGSVDHWASPLLRLGASTRFEMTDNPDVTSGGVTIREDASYWVSYSKVWTEYLLNDRLHLDMDAAYMIKRYDEKEFRDLADENRLLVNAGLRYRLAEKHFALLFVGYDRPTYEGDLRGEYNGYLVGAGLSREFSQRLRGSVSAGYKHLAYDDAQGSDEGMPFVQALAEFRVSEDLTVKVQGDYSLEPSDRIYYSSKEYARFLLKGTYALSQGLSADAQFSYANGAYDSDTAIQEAAGLSDLLPDGDDTLLDVQVGLTIRPVGSRYYGRLAYSFEDWESDVRESYERNTVTVLAGMEF